jgi:hypothetical protein
VATTRLTSLLARLRRRRPARPGVYVVTDRPLLEELERARAALADRRRRLGS